MIWILSIVIVAAVCAAVLLVRALTAFSPGATEILAVDRGGTVPTGGDSLSLLTWNIGYAGLGQEADFVADGGRRFRPGSRALVEKNLDGLLRVLREDSSDVVCLQEVARAGILTRGVDVSAAVRTAFDLHDAAQASTIRIDGALGRSFLDVGSMTLSRRSLRSAVRHSLPNAPGFAGVTVQHFQALEVSFGESPGPKWMVLNLHLSAFDDGDLRRRQLDHVIRLAETAYAAGFRVVAGGDWNFRLSPAEFAHDSPPKARAWVRDLPKGVLPAGWSWAFDDRVPTCRTLDRPYVSGANFTLVIDGFLVSPNVEVLGVETLDLDFAHSDHNPVRIRVRGR